MFNHVRLVVSYSGGGCGRFLTSIFQHILANTTLNVIDYETGSAHKDVLFLTGLTQTFPPDQQTMQTYFECSGIDHTKIFTQETLRLSEEMVLHVAFHAHINAQFTNLPENFYSYLKSIGNTYLPVVRTHVTNLITLNRIFRQSGHSPILIRIIPTSNADIKIMNYYSDLKNKKSENVTVPVITASDLVMNLPNHISPNAITLPFEKFRTKDVDYLVKFVTSIVFKLGITLDKDKELQIIQYMHDYFSVQPAIEYSV